MTSIVDLTAARLTAQVTSRTVYAHAVPKLPAALYLWVYSDVPLPSSLDLADSQTIRGVTVWINSVASDSNPGTAAAEAMAGAQMAQDALTGWRPLDGAWKPVPISSQPPIKDDDIPGQTVFYAVSTWQFNYEEEAS